MDSSLVKVFPVFAFVGLLGTQLSIYRSALPLLVHKNRLAPTGAHRYVVLPATDILL